MILLRLKKLNEIFRPAVEPMFDDGKKKIVAHRAVPSPMAEVDMTTIRMIRMMIFLGRGIRNVGHTLNTTRNLLTCSRGSQERLLLVQLLKLA